MATLSHSPLRVSPSCPPPAAPTAELVTLWLLPPPQKVLLVSDASSTEGPISRGPLQPHRGGTLGFCYTAGRLWAKEARPKPCSAATAELSAGVTDQIQPCRGSQAQHPPLPPTSAGRARMETSQAHIGTLRGSSLEYAVGNPVCQWWEVQECSIQAQPQLAKAAATSCHCHDASLPHHTCNISHPILCNLLGADGTPGRGRRLCSTLQSCGISRDSGKVFLKLYY